MNIFKRLFGKEEKKNEQTNPIQNKENIEELEQKALEELQAMPQKDRDLLVEMMNKLSGNSVIETNTPELFKFEVYDSMNRYISMPEVKIELDLKDDEGNPLKEHEAFDATYSEWMKIQSAWDRRALLFRLWDESEFERLQKWQILERFIKDRYALKALDFHQTSVSLDDFKDIRVILALSKLYRVMDSIPDAKHFAAGAYELRPDLDIVKVEYANVLHLCDSQEEKELAHKLITEVIENKITESEEKQIGVLNYFMFSEGYIDSSIFAVMFLKEGNCDAETWDKLAEEYYWCPIYRFEHSVFLSQNDDGLRALAKLDSLANEFPWHKSGVLAYIDAINQLRIQRNDSNFMSKEMNKMEENKSMWRE